MGNRIKYLDGLRGLAILLVIIFHAYSRWKHILPYGNEFSNAFTSMGRLGVELFFLISGFVILMTLEKCESFKEFIIKRWMRLFPTMLIATVLIYMTSGYLFERPFGIPVIRDAFPGLTFIHPVIWKIILGGNQGQLEGVFWSLYIEIAFYIFFGIMYYLFKIKKAIHILIGAFLLGWLLIILDEMLIFEWISSLKFALSFLLGFKYFGWFASGALFYLFYKSRENEYFIFAIIISLFSMILESRFDGLTLLFCVFIVAIFVLPLYFEKVRIVLSSSFFNFIGFISYPLYLIHENAMIAIILKLNKALPAIPGFLLPIIPVLILVGISFVIAKYLEPYIQKIIRIILIKIKLLATY